MSAGLNRRDRMLCTYVEFVRCTAGQSVAATRPTATMMFNSRAMILTASMQSVHPTVTALGEQGAILFE